MDYAFEWPNESRLIAALKELDLSKALVRKSQSELGAASSNLSRSGRSTECSIIFAAMNRRLNEATERYLFAIQIFNIACLPHSVAANAW